MTSTFRATRALILTASLLIGVGIAVLWASAMADKAGSFGPGCAAEFSC